MRGATLYLNEMLEEREREQRRRGRKALGGAIAIAALGIAAALHELRHIARGARRDDVPGDRERCRRSAGRDPRRIPYCCGFSGEAGTGVVICVAYAAASDEAIGFCDGGRHSSVRIRAWRLYGASQCSVACAR